MSHQRYTPKEALQLWSDPEWIAQACDVYEHPAYCQAKQTTRCFGRLMVEELDRLGGVAGLTERVANLIRLPPKDFAGQVPPVEVKSVPKTKVPTDHEAGADSLCPTEVVEVPQRPIVVAPLVRRALSIHLSEILDATADHLLPKEAIAYRPGRSEVVQSAILDVARAVRGGCTHWTKQDVSNFFPSVPWQGIEAALRGFGYPDGFTERAMALVKGRLAKRAGWKVWAPVENGAGTQAGLRESSILANLFLSGLDRRLLDRFGDELYYRRYSDDMLLMGYSKEVVRKAVVEVENWIESRGLALKGIPPRNSPSSRPDARSLVHSNRNMRVEFLGAQINSLGHIYIPREKVEVFVAKITHREKYCTVHLDEAYYGYSTFSLLVPTGEQRGRYRFDQEDIAEMVNGFKTYWENLGAINLGATMDSSP